MGSQSFGLLRRKQSPRMAPDDPIGHRDHLPGIPLRQVRLLHLLRSLTNLSNVITASYGHGPPKLLENRRHRLGRNLGAHPLLQSIWQRPGPRLFLLKQALVMLKRFQGKLDQRRRGRQGGPIDGRCHGTTVLPPTLSRPEQSLSCADRQAPLRQIFFKPLHTSATTSGLWSTPYPTRLSAKLTPTPPAPISAPRKG